METAAGSASAGIDYTTTAGFVDILPGTFSATVDVPILNDAVAEGIARSVGTRAIPQRIAA